MPPLLGLLDRLIRLRREVTNVGKRCNGFASGDQVGMQETKHPTAGSMIVHENLAVNPSLKEVGEQHK